LIAVVIIVAVTTIGANLKPFSKWWLTAWRNPVVRLVQQLDRSHLFACGLAPVLACS
jgi:hypothetical protein